VSNGITGLLNHIKEPIAKATNERSEKTSQLDSSLEASTMQALRHDVTDRQDCRLVFDLSAYDHQVNEVDVHLCLFLFRILSGGFQRNRTRPSPFYLLSDGWRHDRRPCWSDGTEC
jgi:hypothetical protein